MLLSAAFLGGGECSDGAFYAELSDFKSLIWGASFQRVTDLEIALFVPEAFQVIDLGYDIVTRH